MMQRRSTTRAAVHAALWLALGWAPLTGCARLPWFHRGQAVPRAPRVTRARQAAAPAASAAVPPGRPALHALAARHVAADSLALAEPELRVLLERDPDDAVALSLLSKLLYRSGRHREALALLEPVRTRPAAFSPPARRALLAGLALHQDALGRTDEALPALAEAREAGADGADGALSVAVYLALRGEAPDSAAVLAGEALHREGRSAVNLNNFGITRLRAGDPEAARRAFAGAIERDPSLPGPYYNLAILEKFYRFDDTGAARWFGAYWERSHDDPDSLRAAFPASLAGVASPEGGRP